ncbi:kelch repeat-containing protein [Sorangium sp. So ce134]
MKNFLAQGVSHSVRGQRPGGLAPDAARARKPSRHLVVVLAAMTVVLFAAEAGASGTWTKRVTSGPAPTERSTPAVAAIGDAVYLFGGMKDDFSTFENTFYNDLYRFDTSLDSWELLEPAGDLPPPRVFAGAAADECSNVMLVFGGATYSPDFSDFVAYDDLWAYDADADAWIEIHAENAGPVGRSRPNVWFAGGKLYVFGGVTSAFEFMNDLWVYDLASNRWKELVPAGAPGSPRGRHEAMAGTTPIRGKLTLYGGETMGAAGFEMLDDTWEFDLRTRRWTEVTPRARRDITPPRNYGAAAVIGWDLYLQGGDVSGGSSGCGAPFEQNPIEELWRYSPVQRKWTKLSPGGDPLVRLKRHVATEVNGAMYLFSGWDFACDGGVGPGQLWNRDVYSFDP